MTFLAHHGLWLLLALPMLGGVYVALRRRKSVEALRYSDLGLAREAMEAAHWMRRHLPPLLFLLGLAALILAVARPAAVITGPAQQGTVILTIDVSLSMAANDVAPTRLGAAVAAMTHFVEAQPKDVRIGVVAFGGQARVVQSPTLNRRAVLAALDRLELQPYTGIGTGLVTAVLTIHPGAGVDGERDIYGVGWEPMPAQPLFGPHLLYPPARDRTRPPTAGADLSTAIILVSDGYGTIGVPPSKAARIAANHGIRVYTVGVGTPYGGTARVEGWSPIHAEFQEETLKEIADITRGEYFHTRNAGKLKKVYDKLTRQAVLAKKEFEIAAPIAAIGAVLLLTAAALSLLWHHRFA